MKRYTQTDFDNFEVDEFGYKICPGLRGESKMNIKTTTREEYIVCVKNKVSGKYIMGHHPCKADTLKKVKEYYSEYRKYWEKVESENDFNDYEIRHRTVVTTDWDVVE